MLPHRWWICLCKNEYKGMLIAAKCKWWKLSDCWENNKKKKFKFQLWRPLTRAFTSLPPLLQPANQWHPCKVYLGALIACRRVGVFLWILISFWAFTAQIFVCLHSPALCYHSDAVMPPNQHPANTEDNEISTKQEFCMVIPIWCYYSFLQRM